MIALFYVVVIVAIILAYFAPTIVAVFRPEAKNKNYIFFANMLFGWTFLGWVACLIWALLSGTERASRIAHLSKTYVPRAMDEAIDGTESVLKSVFPKKDDEKEEP